MVSAGSYVLSAAALAVLVASLALSAAMLRRRLLPAWGGAPARLVEAIVAIALLTWLCELLGTFGLLYASTLLVASAIVAGVCWRLVPARVNESDSPTGPAASPADGPLPEGDAGPVAAQAEGQPQRRGGGAGSAAGPAAPSTLALLVTLGVVALVTGHWAITAKHALDRGIFNFDSLWYHLPFAADIAQSHSTTGLHRTETVFTNWFYPQGSELLHAVAILLTHRDTLSLFVNFGWLALAFLAAWCVGRPYGRGHLTVAAAAVVLECHTLVVREPGAAKNDVAAAALLLAAVAILVNAWAASRECAGAEAAGATTGGANDSSAAGPPGGGVPQGGAASGGGAAARALPPGWPLAAAGLAAGLAAGTKVTALAMAAALTVAAIALAPAGRRRAATVWWLVPALAGGGYWYLRNLVAAGNPLPQIGSLGPISLPHPERLQTARPDFSIAHYATDTGVWRYYFAPGLHDQFGVLWPLVLGGALLGALLALVWGRHRLLRWIGAVALFGWLAYLFTPLSAAGLEGAPAAFEINVRFVIPALLLSASLLPLARGLESPRRQWALLVALLIVLVVSDRADAVARDPARAFALALVLLLVLAPAALLYARARGAGAAALAVGCAALALAVVALGYPLQRHYLRDRFLNQGPAEERIPGMGLDSAYRWARDTSGLRIGLAGTTAGFLQYGFYGTDLSNRVLYLGKEGPHGAFNAIPTCRAFRAAVNAAGLDYLVTAPFLNFIHPDRPIASPEASWLRGSAAVAPLLRSGRATVWRVRGRLDEDGCGPRNAPLRRVPNTPGA